MSYLYTRRAGNLVAIDGHGAYNYLLPHEADSGRGL
jgi:hypothetical protein